MAMAMCGVPDSVDVALQAAGVETGQAHVMVDGLQGSGAPGHSAGFMTNALSSASFPPSHRHASL